MALRFLAILLLVLNVGLSRALAGEGEGEGAKEGGEGKGKTEKGNTVLATPEWIDVQAKLATVKAKVASKQKAIEDLIHEKDVEKDPRKLHEVVENLKREHKELRGLVEEYEQQRNYFRYRFPEKGMKEGQKYKRIEVKPLEEMEEQASLDGHLQHTLRKVRKQYGEAEATSAGAPKTTLPVRRDQNPITEPAVLAK